MMERDEFLEVAEAAAWLGVSESTIRRMFDAGILAGFRLPGGLHRRISLASLRAFVARGGGRADAKKAVRP
jgi:excisionase family DNA binding protein